MSTSAVNESAIMERLILSPEKAETILSLAFAREDQERMRELRTATTRAYSPTASGLKWKAFDASVRSLASCRRAPRAPWE